MEETSFIQENKGLLEIIFVAGIFVILIVGLFWKMSSTMAKQKRKRQAIKEAQKYAAREQQKREEQSQAESGS